MRTNEPDPTPQRVLGERVTKPAPVQRPDWKPLPHNSQVEADRHGHLRTQIPLPKSW